MNIVRLIERGIPPRIPSPLWLKARDRCEPLFCGRSIKLKGRWFFCPSCQLICRQSVDYRIDKKKVTQDEYETFLRPFAP